VDPTALIALFGGVAVVLLGNYIEGGHVASLIQPAAGFIVAGGTATATILSFSNSDLKALKTAIPSLWKKPSGSVEQIGEKLQEIATVVRRDGLLAAEALVPDIKEPVLQRGLRMLVDGATVESVVPLLETESEQAGHIHTHAADVLDSAGGYAPTVGILGAVLGLIHVMNNISDPEKLGSGIAVAFVATIYGVGLANLILLPVAKRFRRIGAEAGVVRELSITGLEAIANGATPQYIGDIASVYSSHGDAHGKKAAA
jgi:chemotaxis protein MotA